MKAGQKGQWKDFHIESNKGDQGEISRDQRNYIKGGKQTWKRGYGDEGEQEKEGELHMGQPLFEARSLDKDTISSHPF